MGTRSRGREKKLKKGEKARERIKNERTFRAIPGGAEGTCEGAEKGSSSKKEEIISGRVGGGSS